MTTPENQKPQPWNPDVAVPLFQELARMQVEGGLFAAYVRGMQAHMDDTDPEDAADTRSAIYIELPLAVEARYDPGETAEGFKDLYLAKVNPSDGQIVEHSILNTGYVVEEATGTVSPLSADSDHEPVLTPEQAVLAHEQYKIQEEAGLRITDGEAQS